MLYICNNGQLSPAEVGDLEALTARVINLEDNKADKTAIPTKTSDLSNDSGFITKSDIPSIPEKTSDLINDSEFVTLDSLPTKVSDLINDTGFITNTVNNLTNYYTKANTYTKSEVNDLINALSSLGLSVVTELPTSDISTTTIYLVPNTASSEDNIYDEYIYVNNKWELIGSTAIDLSNYATKEDLEYIDNDLSDLNLAVFGGIKNYMPETYTAKTATGDDTRTITLQDDGTFVINGKRNSTSSTVAAPSLMSSNYTLKAGTYKMTGEFLEQNITRSGSSGEPFDVMSISGKLYTTSGTLLKEISIRYQYNYSTEDVDIAIDGTTPFTLASDTSVYLIVSLSTSTGAYYYQWNNSRVAFMILDSDDSSETYFPSGKLGGLMNDIKEKENLHELVTLTLSSSNWIGTSAPYKYSLESSYAATDYAIEQMQPIGDSSMFDTWSKAKIIGNNDISENYIYAYGEKPTSNISVMFYVKAR